MDNKKPQVGTSSSLTSQLFGSQDSSLSSDVLASIFPPSKAIASWQKEPSGNQLWNSKQDNTYKHGEGSPVSKERNTIYQQEGADPCYLSSSLYYGGREMFSKSPNTSQIITSSYPISKKDGRDDNPSGASRGNWWQGSLYY